MKNTVKALIYMSTQKQIEANRRNSLKSTGPITPAGKQIVSQNATTHGLRAARAIVLPEEQEEFARFDAALREEYVVEGGLERVYLERLIQCGWRLQRITRVETSVLLDMYKKQYEPDAADERTLGRAYTEAFPALNTLSRYERHIERSFREAQQELELLQYSRQLQSDRFYCRNLRKFPAPGTERRKEEGPIPPWRPPSKVEF
jgi:hypothetical protein